MGEEVARKERSLLSSSFTPPSPALLGQRVKKRKKKKLLLLPVDRDHQPGRLAPVHGSQRQQQPGPLRRPGLDALFRGELDKRGRSLGGRVPEIFRVFYYFFWGGVHLVQGRSLSAFLLAS